MKIATVKDLRKALNIYPDNTKVYMSIDEEGNMFHPILDIWTNEGTIYLYPNQSEILEEE
jgi:hypothetical protein